jgi:7-cyano-7-deazaguanine synthase
MKALVILSGGLDSTTLLYDVISQGYEVQALSFNYRQKHVKEIEGAKATCKVLNIPHKIVSLEVLNDLAPSAITRDLIEVPEGHYASSNMSSTVVPNRNMVLIALAASYAISEGISKIFYGAHSGDHAIYPDCRPEFVKEIQDVLKICDYISIDLEAPYLNLTKGDILRIGLNLGVNYSLTWTCYNGREKACGKCGSCTERLEAFEQNKEKDPIKYEV